MQNLRTEYEQITFRDDEFVEDFALRLSNMVHRLVILGDPEPEAKVVAKYLRVVRCGTGSSSFPSRCFLTSARY